MWTAHALGSKRDHVAILWEGEPDGEVRKLTFGDLHLEVQKFANVLKAQGIRKGDRVAIYMGMTPELAIALLACVRIGCDSFGHLWRLRSACTG